MEGAVPGPIPEAGFDEPDDAKEKKSGKLRRHSREVIGAAATKSAERPETAEKPPKETEMTPEEVPVVRRELALAAKQANAAALAEPEADPAVAAGNLAADRLYDEVIAGSDFEAAEQTVLAELGLPETEVQVEVTPAETEPDDDTGAGSGGASGGAPPRGLVPPAGPPSSPGGPGDPNNMPSPGGFRPNFMPTPTVTSTAPNKPTSRPEQIYDDNNPAVAALIGGVIGYLIGRRRGRIKTEKKLLPIQKKLAGEVVDLQWQLKAKETKLRRVVAEQVQAQGSAESSLISRQRAPEAQALHSEQKPEHIGHVLMTNEARPKGHNEQPQPAEFAAQKRLETLNRPELLDLSDNIIIDGSSLHQIYETHLIGEHGLRRLVSEYLQGGDLKKALRQEIMEREIDFERDPVMRDMGTVSVPSTTATAGPNQAALDQLLKRAAASVPAADMGEESAFYKARANYEAKQHEQQKRQRRLTDILLAATAAALLAAALIVYLIKH